MTETLRDHILSLTDDKLHVFYLGQAGFVLRNSKGELLGNDLYLSDACELVHGSKEFKRLAPKVLAPEDLVFDYLIATHPHMDHFDPLAMPKLMENDRTHLYCSTDCKRLVVEEGLEESRVSYHQSGETVQAGAYQIHFISCDHGDGAPDAFGVIIEVDGIRILEVGDSSLHLEWKEEYLKYGEIDLMFAPMNGRWGNLNEEECASLADAVKPKLLVPCHFGMCAAHGGNPRHFYDVMTNYPKQDWSFMALGDTLVF